MKAFLNIASAAFAFLAACAWAYSAYTTAIYAGPTTRPPGTKLPSPALLYGVDAKEREIDLIPTLIKQSKWSRYAASLAAVAALCQGLSAF